MSRSFDEPYHRRRLPTGEEIRDGETIIGYIEPNKDGTWSVDRGLSWKNITCPSAESREDAIAMLKEWERRDPTNEGR